jgi:hypothetical protein
MCMVFTPIQTIASLAGGPTGYLVRDQPDIVKKCFLARIWDLVPNQVMGLLEDCESRRLQLLCFESIARQHLNAVDSWWIWVLWPPQIRLQRGNSPRANAGH